MTALPIVDSHLHLWDPERFRMSWLDGNPVLDRPYGLPEFRAATDGLPVEEMVFMQTEVEPPYALLEARWVIEQAARDERLRAIVPWAPAECGEQLRSYLEALVEMSPLIKGVRRIIQFEPDLDFCLRPDFVRGVQIVAGYGFTFDICIDHRQLANATELVRRCPGTFFILDHVAKPDIRNRVLDPWRDQMAAMAALPNVVCKISGMVTEASWVMWTPEDLRPYVQHTIDVFGEDRILFGGDWPVMLQASSYRRWVETLDALTAHLSLEARRKLWSENARRVYRLGPSVP